MLVLPAPVVIQQPIADLSHLTNVPRQTVPPRLLHGRSIQSSSAVVLGFDSAAGREGPGAVYSEVTQFVGGQVVLATRLAGGGDGFDWFLIASTNGQQAWIRGDRLSFFEGSR